MGSSLDRESAGLKTQVKRLTEKIKDMEARRKWISRSNKLQ